MFFITTKDHSGYVVTTTHATEADYDLTMVELVNNPSVEVIDSTY